MTKKDRGKRNNLRAADRFEMEEFQSEERRELLFEWKYSFKLLGAVLYCRWLFGEQNKELRPRVIQRLSVPGEAARTLWSFESRILSKTRRSFIERVVNYGVTAHGTHCC